MNERDHFDLCVIGAGSAGLSLAAGAAQLGLSTVLIEAHRMGGDCLHTGCVPSKSLLAVAKLAHAHHRPHLPGIPAHDFAVERAGVNAHLRSVIAAIEPHDSPERFEGLGVTVIHGFARFTGPREVEVNGRRITAEDIVVATGSRAAIPDIRGLEPARALTNETIFALDTVPEHLVIVGGGPIGVEMAQAHARLGAKVTLLQRGTILPKDEPELVAVLRARLAKEGVDIVEDAAVEAVRHGEGHHTVAFTAAGTRREIRGSHLLLATGRKVNLDGLDLERAGVEHGPKGVAVDARLRTTNRHVHAIGDCAGGPQFTHAAGYQAGILVRNLVFRQPAKVDYSALPRVTYADPELAHVGLTLQEARERHGDKAKALVQPMAKLDRALAEGRGEGLLKLVALPNGAILGCSILSANAGESIGVWCLAVSKGMKLKDVAGLVLPYPTLGEVSKQAAGEWYKPTLFSDRTKTFARLLRKLPRW